jgi:hypothetical protein
MSLSQPRMTFVSSASRMLEQLQAIDEILKKDDEDAGSDHEANDETESTESSTKLDPQSITMIRNTLEDRSKLIERGYNFAVSALVLIDAIFDNFPTNEEAKRQLLLDLIIGTIHHSGLSSITVYEILQHTVPELTAATITAGVGNDTCKSPWADLCGGVAATTIRRGDNVELPPRQLVDAVKKFCTEKQQAHAAAGSAAVCISADPMPPLTIDTIPSDIGDGYFGYTLVKERTDDDILDSILPPNIIQDDEDLKRVCVILKTN